MEHTKYLHELEIYDGEAFIVFNIISLSVKKGEVVLAMTNRGKITVVTYDLRSDEKRTLLRVRMYVREGKNKKI